MGKKRKIASTLKTDGNPVQKGPSKMEVATREDDNKELVDAAEGGAGLSRHFGGVLDESICGYLNQAFKAHPDYGDPESQETTVSRVMGAVLAIKPKNDIECMLVVQAVAVHSLSMEMMSRATYADRISAIDSAINRATKLSRTFVALIEALNKHRGKGQQKMTVEHIHVNRGGQAIVGNVGQVGEGKNEK